MRPELKYILQEKFHGHEADVGPGVWDAIRSQINTPPASDPVEDLFRERFRQHEAHVDPGVWNAIGAQLGHGAAAGTAVSSSFLSWMAAGLGTIAVSAGLYLYSTTNTPVETADLQAPRNTEVIATPTATEEPTATLPEEQVSSTGPVTSDAEPSTTPSGRAMVSPAGGTLSDKAEPPSTATPRPQHTPMDRIQTRTPGTDLARTPEPRQGSTIVGNVIQKLAGEVYQEAIAAEQLDPQGPPPVELDRMDGNTADKERGIHQAAPEIFMPNTFTPNGDGINDTYKIDRDGFQSMMIRIYSLHTNTLVFSTDSNEEWDGGNCEKGYYLVAIEAVTDDGRLVTKGKAVWLNNDRY